ncbi:MAG: hypothetical protein R3B67_01985 [Phycisphaerales bacterium]
MLRATGFPFSEREVLLVELSEGHSLSKLCLFLLGAEINIAFAYPLLHRSRQPRASPSRSMTPHWRGRSPSRKGFKMLGECDLHQ